MEYIDEEKLLEHLRHARDYFEQGSYEKSYKQAQAALNMDPANDFANKLIKKAAKKIRQIRKRELKKRIKALKPLWDIREYEKLLKEYKTLNKFYPDYIPVLIKIAYLKSKIRKEEEKTSATHKKNIIKEIKTLHKQGQYMQAIQGLEQVKPYFEGELWPEKLDKKIKHDYVVDQLKYKKELLEHQEYEKLYRFLSKLYTIFPEPRIKKHISATENLIFEKRKYEKSVFIEESLDLINSLYAQGKYEDSMQVCEELMSLTGETHIKARTFYVRSKNANEKEMNVMIKQMMITKNKTLKKEYAENTEEFVRI